MHLRCPHCHSPFELVDTRPSAEVVCPSCGSSFQLENEKQSTWSLLPAHAPRRLGKFELIEQLGMGAFGTVYKARDLELDRIVAIKVPRAGNLATLADEDRFLREARAAAQLRHPNIVSIYDAGATDNTCFLVSEYVQGVTLADRLTSGPLGFREAAVLMATVAEALDYAHRQGVVHRDLKPSNIMLDLAEQPHVLDFGLAKRDAGEITVTLDGQVLGTPAYMSPEQAGGAGHNVDARSDVYSLGVILYELLTGELPFRGNQRMLILQVMRDEPRPPRRLNDHIPRDLETITLKSLSKDPQRRYQTAADLAAELHRWLRGEPIQARPLSRPVRLWRWCQRNPLAFAVYVLAFSTVFVLVAALVRIDREKSKTASALSENRQQLALNYAQRGTALLSSGDSAGMSWLLRGLETTGPQDPARAAILNLMGGWAESVGSCVMHNDGIVAVACSPDGTLVATAGWDNTARIWDAATGEPRGTPLRHEDAVRVVVFSPDSKTVLTGSRDHTARLWDAATGEPRGQPMLHDDILTAVAFSPDGKTVLTGSADKTARLWDETSHPAPRDEQVSLSHDDQVLAVAFSSDGQSLITGSETSVQHWDAATGERGLTLRVGQLDSESQATTNEDVVQGVAFSPDGKRVLTRSGNLVRLWDVAAGESSQAQLRHESAVSAAVFSPDGKLVVTGSRDKVVRLWDAVTTRPLGTPVRHEGAVIALAVSPDGRSVLSASGPLTRRWPVSAGELSRTSLSHEGLVLAAAFTPEGPTIVTGGHDHTARLWDARTGTARAVVLQHDAVVQAVGFSGDGSLLVTGSADKTARLWDAATGTAIGKPMVHAGAVNTVAFSPDGKTIFTASDDKRAWLWDVVTRQRRALALPEHAALRAAVFSPDSQTLLTSSVDETARFWNVATGQPLDTRLRHERLVGEAAFSPDGRTVLFGSEDKTAKLWELSTGELCAAPLRHDDTVDALAFSPDGRTILSVDENRTARFWQVAPAIPDSLDSVRRWVEAQTGQTWDQDDRLRPLTFDEWLDRRTNVALDRPSI